MNTRIKATKALLVVMLVLLGLGAVAGCAKKEPAAVTPTQTAPSQEATPAETEDASAALTGDALIVDACTTCHSAARIYLQPDSTDWAATIDRMVNTHMKSSMFGESISPEQKAAIIKFMLSRTQSEGEQVVRNKCSKCHDLARLTAQPLDTDWLTVVDRMSKAHGLVLTAEEQAQALEFLENR